MSSTSSEDLSVLSRASTVHLLPCEIQYDGPAPVSSYFLQSTNSRNEKTSYFRGRELKGLVVPVPEGTIGVHAIRNPSQRTLDISGEFSEINLWQHDFIPSTKQLKDVGDWIELSRALSEV